MKYQFIYHHSLINKKDKMSSSDEEIDTQTAQHVIKPAKGGAQLDTSTWPLLLKVRPFTNLQKGGRQLKNFNFYLSFFWKTL
jgi:hypothetical protein